MLSTPYPIASKNLLKPETFLRLQIWPTFWGMSQSTLFFNKWNGKYQDYSIHSYWNRSWKWCQTILQVGLPKYSPEITDFTNYTHLLFTWKFLEVCLSTGCSCSFHCIGLKLMASLCGIKHLQKGVWCTFSIYKTTLIEVTFFKTKYKKHIVYYNFYTTWAMHGRPFLCHCSIQLADWKRYSTFRNVEIREHHSMGVRRTVVVGQGWTQLCIPPHIISEKWLPFGYSKFWN